MLASILGIAADAVLITLILALAASGLAVIFGLIGVINLGHGAMLTLGAYFMWWATAHGVPFVETETLERALAEAASAASEPDVVLLSPACASFDQFASFEHRGEEYRRLVQNLSA